MDLKVKFSEPPELNMRVGFQESDKEIGADFGEFQTVNIGEDGATFTPYVSPDGVISWTNDRELPNPKPVNIKGAKGESPVKGKDYFTPEDVNGIVDAVLREVMEKFRPARIGEVTIRANSWVGAASPYSQVVSVEGVTEYSQVDLTPGVAQLAAFHEKDLEFVTENDGGVVTVYAIGQKPANDYTIQVTITEVFV